MIVRNKLMRDLKKDIGTDLGTAVADNILEINIAVHPKESNVIVINYPGFDGDINGYNDKYLKIGELVHEKIGAVVRMGNPYYSDLPYPDAMIQNLEFVIDYSLKNSEIICNTSKPKLHMMGFSAGASAIAAISSKYSEIEKLLLVAPSSDAGFNTIQKGLENYTGELSVVVGKNDEVVGSKIGLFYSELAKSASKKKLEVIQNCDHQFRGIINGKILSKTPQWAFLDDKSFPSHHGGTILYN